MIQFSRETLQGLGKKHLRKVVYEMARQSQAQGPTDCDLSTLNSAIDVCAERLGGFSKLHRWQELESFIGKLERELKLDLVDSDFLVSHKDTVAPKGGEVPMVLLLENLRSAFNVGSCIRSLEAHNGQAVYFSGYTASPENSKAARSALGTEDWVEWKSFENSADAVSELRQQGYKIYAVETAAESTSLYQAEIQFPCCFVLGNERFGLSDSTLEVADEIIHVPLYGRKNSLNVAVCAGILLYEGARQWNQ